MWFEKLMGFKEINPELVRNNIEINDEVMISKINGKSYQSGILEVISVAELKQKIELKSFPGKISLAEIVGDVQQLHIAETNRYSLFQAASQFNLLEMVNPTVTPERGVGIYENDNTQGPACAISCGAGTIFRNYFAPVHGKIGQSANNQIDGLELIGEALGNKNNLLWKMQNGYCFPSQEGLVEINSILSKLSSAEFEDLKGLLKVGIQWNTEVTIAENPEQIVSQIYCSALPIGYSSFISEDYFEYFAKLILDATYEATFYAALFNFKNGGSNHLFLTLVGGGVFQNKLEWILEAIEKSVMKFKNTPLQVNIVSYGASNKAIQQFIQNLKI